VKWRRIGISTLCFSLVSRLVPFTAASWSAKSNPSLEDGNSGPKERL